MKRQYGIVVTIILLIILTGGCKKSSTPENNTTPKDYSALVINKTWWGAFAYRDQTEEYYSMHFNQDKTLDWDQLLGPFKGFWTLDGNRLTLTFEGNDTKITADIGDDKKLSHISDNTNFSEIESGQLIENPNLSLENSVWTGMQTGQTPTSIKLEFDNQHYVLPFFSGAELDPYPYSRSSSGAVIRSAYPPGSSIFLIIISESEMYGGFGSYLYPVHVTKQ